MFGFSTVCIGQTASTNVPATATPMGNRFQNAAGPGIRHSGVEIGAAIELAEQARTGERRDHRKLEEEDDRDFLDEQWVAGQPRADEGRYSRRRAEEAPVVRNADQSPCGELEAAREPSTANNANPMMPVSVVICRRLLCAFS